MATMPTGWICRTRTDGAPETEPAIVLQYELVPGDVVLKDVAKLIGAAPAGATVRVVTCQESVREALRQWSSANSVVRAYEDEAMVLAVGGCFTEYIVDLRRVTA